MTPHWKYPPTPAEVTQHGENLSVTGRALPPATMSEGKTELHSDMARVCCIYRAVAWSVQVQFIVICAQMVFQG